MSKDYDLDQERLLRSIQEEAQSFQQQPAQQPMVDNSPEALFSQKLQEMMDNSPDTQRAAQW